MSKERRKSLGQAVLLVVGVFIGQMILYGPSLLGRKVLLPLDILTVPQVYIPQTPELQKTVHNLILSDLLYIGEPTRQFLHKELWAGRWPTWNPDQFAGAPTLSPRFSPFIFLTMLFASPIILAWVQVLIAEVAAIGFYWFCRRALGTNFWPAIIIAWCYPLTGYFIFWQGFCHPMTVCWLPWLLIMVDAVVSGGTRWAWSGMVLGTGIIIVSGQTDVAGQVLLTSGLFAIWKLVEVFRPHFFYAGGRRRCLRTALVLAGGWGAGFLLAAPHLLPMIEYTSTGARMERRGMGEEERPPIGLVALPQVVVPHFYGSTETGLFPAFPDKQGNLLESMATGYAGLLATLLLAPLAFCSRRHRSLNLFWVLLTFIALSWQLNIPGMVWLLRLPLLNMMSHNRFTFAAAFSILAMAAVGLDVLAKGQWERRWWFNIPVGLLGILLLTAGFLSLLPFEPIYSQLALAIRQGQVIGQISSYGAVQLVEWNFMRIYLVTVIFCTLGLMGWLLAYQKLQTRWLSAIAGTLMGIELLWYGYGRASQCDWSLYYPEIPVLKQVAQEAEANHSRVIGIGCLPATLAQTQGLNDVRGYDAVDPARYVELLLKAGDTNSPRFSYALTQMMIPANIAQLPNQFRLHPILDMLGVRYLILRGTPPKGIKSIVTGDDYWVIENESAMPRVFIPKSVELASREKCLNQLAEVSFNPQKVAYVESRLPIDLPTECRGTAEIISSAPTKVVVSATMETAGILVLADRWDKGWGAYIESELTPIRQVNYALRGVELPAGKFEVMFCYKSEGLTWGLWLSLLAIVITSVVIFRKRNYEDPI